MKILHFSDLHLQDSLPEGFSWLLDKRLLGTLTQHLRRARKQDLTTLAKLLHFAQQVKPDIILCTGDLTTVALPGEFHRAMGELAPLRSLVPPQQFLFVPGNHDAYIRRPESIRALRQVQEQLTPELNAVDFQPFQRKLENVTFFVLDAARPRPPWNSGGVATARQLESLEELLKKNREPGECRCLITHFPLLDQNGRRLNWRRRIKQDREILRLVREYHINLICCGHIHKPFIQQFQQTMQVCPGSLTLAHQVAVLDIQKDRLTATLIDLNRQTQQTFDQAFQV